MADVPRATGPGWVEKLVVFLPFVGISAALVSAYTALHAMLVARLGALPVDAELVELWLPVALPWIPVVLWLRPRLRVLRLGKGRVGALYLLAGAALMSAPGLPAQRFASAAAGRLTRLGSIGDIEARPVTRYYDVEAPCLDRSRARVERSATLGGRQRERLVFELFVAVPFCAPGDPEAEPVAWLGVRYAHGVSSRLADDAKDAEWRAFLAASQEALDGADLAAFSYLELMGPGPRRRGYEAAIGGDAGAARVLLARQGAFEERGGRALRWTVVLFLAAAALFLVLVLVPRVDRVALRRLHEGRVRTGRPPWRDWLLPSRGTYGPWSLVAANVLVFAAMVVAGLGVLGFRRDDLLAWGANHAPLLTGVGLLRLVTSQFVHAGLAHLAGNLYGLVVSTLLLTPIVRGWALVLLYVGTGVVAGVTSALAHPLTVSVGASGAVFGLFGVLLGSLLRHDERLAKARGFVLANVGLYAGVNLALGAVTPGVDLAAHLGGLCAGLVVGLVAPVPRRGPRRDRARGRPGGPGGDGASPAELRQAGGDGEPPATVGRGGER